MSELSEWFVLWKKVVQEDRVKGWQEIQEFRIRGAEVHRVQIKEFGVAYLQIEIWLNCWEERMSDTRTAGFSNTNPRL